MNGSSTAASNAMMASTHTISSKVKPRCVVSFILGGRRLFEGNVRRGPAATLLTIGPIGDNVIGLVFAGRPIDVWVAPGIARHVAAFQIRAIPRGHSGRAPDKRGKPLRRGREPAGVEIKQIERARETLQLNTCGLDL